MQAILSILLFVIVASTVSKLCNDSVELTNRSYNGIQYEDGEYFMNETTGLERGCVCMKETCMRKCCPLGQAVDDETDKCVDVPEEFNPQVWEGSSVKPEFNATKDFHLVFLSKNMNCSREKHEFKHDIRSYTSDFHIKTDGKLYVVMEKKNVLPPFYGPDKYCVDNFLYGNDDPTTRSMKFSGLICNPEKEEVYHFVQNATCMLISCFFILLTVAVYVFLPKFRTLHGLVMISCLLSFFVSFLFFAIMQIKLHVEDIGELECTSMSFVIYFSLLAGFFWQNVMCYDLWSNFTNLSFKAAAGRGVSKSTNARFRLYSAYGFGMPTALTILLAALEFSGLSEDNEYLPRLRKQGCFLNGNGKLIYWYGPVMILLFINLVFFTLTAKCIAHVKKQTAVLQRKDTQRFALYIKLFLVTGLNWILEVISSFFPELDVLWQITDAYNILLGLIIFIVFICKKDVILAIKQRYKEVMGMPQSQISMETIATSTNSETNQTNA